MRILQSMIQKQKIEAQYLKLIGVTLLMTAACVSDSGNRKSAFFADDHVREIILEQFQLLSTAHFNEVLDWEYAIKEASELPHQGIESTDGLSYSVVTSNQTLPSFDEQLSLYCGSLLLEPDNKLCEAVFWTEPITVCSERNKYSLITRAGPLA